MTQKPDAALARASPNKKPGSGGAYSRSARTIRPRGPASSVYTPDRYEDSRTRPPETPSQSVGSASTGSSMPDDTRSGRTGESGLRPLAYGCGSNKCAAATQLKTLAINSKPGPACQVDHEEGRRRGPGPVAG